MSRFGGRFAPTCSGSPWEFDWCRRAITGRSRKSKILDDILTGSTDMETGEDRWKREQERQGIHKGTSYFQGCSFPRVRRHADFEWGGLENKFGRQDEERPEVLVAKLGIE